MERREPNQTHDDKIASQQVTGIQVSYSGPLPPPQILEQFDRIVPGGAERIFAQFESQSKHRQKIELQVIRSNAFAQILGAISASMIGLIATGGGLFLVYQGKSVEGFGAFFTTLASLVGIYIYGKKSQADERKSK